MSSMTLKHTKSPSGRTHRLTDPKTGQAVTKYYATKPQYDDQVQGDLIREFSRTIFPVVIGILPVHIDPDLLDKGQKEPSLDYLRGYLAGLTATENGAERTRVIRETRERIATMEAQRIGVMGGVTGGPISGAGPLNGPPPAAGAVSIQMNVVQPLEQALPLTAARRAAEEARRMREQS